MGASSESPLGSLLRLLGSSIILLAPDGTAGLSEGCGEDLQPARRLCRHRPGRPTVYIHHEAPLAEFLGCAAAPRPPAVLAKTTPCVQLQLFSWHRCVRRCHAGETIRRTRSPRTGASSCSGSPAGAATLNSPSTTCTAEASWTSLSIILPRAGAGPAAGDDQPLGGGLLLAAGVGLCALPGVGRCPPQVAGPQGNSAVHEAVSGYGRRARMDARPLDRHLWRRCDACSCDANAHVPTLQPMNVPCAGSSDSPCGRALRSGTVGTSSTRTCSLQAHIDGHPTSPKPCGAPPS
eukprot:scaffold3127_cov202-Prasinococcus_capsulatus_cf.AAC.1